MSLSRPARTWEDPLQQLPASAASEIVKSSRASLKETTRPVTPADGGRRLLQSDTYLNRPQTAGGLLSSRDFLRSSDSAGRLTTAVSNAAGKDTVQAIPWCFTSSNVADADIWTADGDLPNKSSNAESVPNAAISSSSRRSSTSTGTLPSLRCSSATSCAGPSPLRPASAVLAVAVCSRRSTSANSSHSGIVRTSSLGIASTHAAGQSLVAPSTDVDCTATCSGTYEGARPSCEGSFSSSGSSSSREAQRDSSIVTNANRQLAGPSSTEPLAASAWQQQVLQAVQVINSLPINPSAADAAALLHACADLQTLLDTAEDRKQLQEWLDACLQDPAAAAPAAVAGPLSAGPAAEQPAGSAPHSTLRTSVLGCLIRLVDCTKADVLVKIGSMMLRSIPLHSRMMLTAAKMLYKLSKDSSNDARFRHHGVLRPLLSVIAENSKAVCQAHGQVVTGSGASDQSLVNSNNPTPQQHRQQDGTALLYLTGCLKNVSADATNQKCLGRLGAVGTMAQVLIDHTAKYPSPQLQQQEHHHHEQQKQQKQGLETAAQVCVQATAVLRNLAIEQSHMQLFAQQGGLAICSLLRLLTVFEHEEVLMDVSRCLSKLSLHSQCRECMIAPCSLAWHTCHSSSSSSNHSSIAALCQQQPSEAAVAQMLSTMLRPQLAANGQWGIILRLAFALGNLTTYHPEARQQVEAVPEALDPMLQLMLDLLQKLQQEQHQQEDPAVPSCTAAINSRAIDSSKASSKPVEDLMIKLLRLLGNIAIDSSAGVQLASKQAAADVVLGVLCSCSFEEHEELVLNAAAALSNLAFYNDPTNKFLHVAAASLLQPLLPLLTSSNHEAAVEAARAISNLARGSVAVVTELLHYQEPGAGISVYEELSPCSCEGHDSALSLQADMLSDSCTSSDSSSTCNKAPAAGAVGPYVLQALVLLLGHSSWEVVCSAAGALVNLTAAVDARPALQQAGLATELQESINHYIAELQACKQIACTAEGNTSTQQQPLAVPCQMMEAAEVLLRCVHNLLSSGQVAAEGVANGCTCSLQCAAAQDFEATDNSCCSGASMVSTLQVLQQGLLEATSSGLMVPDSLLELVAALLQRTNSMSSNTQQRSQRATARYVA